MSIFKRHFRPLYAIVAVIILLVSGYLYEPNPSPEEAPANVSSLKQEKQSIVSVKQSEETKRAESAPSSLVITDRPYKVEVDYPNQHVFDDNMCSVDQLLFEYRKAFNDAIKRLNKNYKRHTYTINDYLSLNIYTPSMSDDFEQALLRKIAYLHNEFILLLGESAKREISLNIVIVPQRADYEGYLSYYSQSPINSAGVYYTGLNIAYVDYQGSEESALRTAIHETVHALSAHIIGKTPRMFSEGMAEFYENMQIKDEDIKIVYSRTELKGEPYPMLQFFDYLQWPNLDIHRLYYSSWAWITYMYNERERLRSLITFMKEEQKYPCEAFSGDEAFAIFQDHDSMMELDFYTWLQQFTEE